jgi:tetratricopeptide (TPR) repeat protein
MLTHHKVDEWVKLVLTALGRAIDMHDEELQGRLYALMGQGHLTRGNLKLAQAAYNNALSQAQDYINDPLVAEEIMLLVYIGQIRMETYAYTDQFTPERVAKIRALARRIDDPMLTAYLHQALAAAYAHRAESEQALGYGMTALGYWMLRGRPLEIARAAHALSMAYSRALLLTQAEQTAEFAYRHVQRDEHTQYSAIISQQRGTIASQKADWREAVKWLEAARESYRALGWEQHEAMTERSLALSYIPQKLFGKATASLDRADAVWERIPNAYEQAAIASTRGYLEGQRGDIEAALADLRAALFLCAGIPEMKARSVLVQSIHDDIAFYTAQRKRPA